MKDDDRLAYIRYRLEKSDETLKAAELLIENELWNSAINRLYYASYYAISSLLFKYNISSKTHAGVKTQFNLNFVKNGKVDIELGKIYGDLFDWRQKSDYGDFFDFKKEDVLSIINPTKELIEQCEKLIEAEDFK